MKNNFLHKGDIVCNPKMNYVRIYVGASLTNWLIDDIKSYSMLKNVLDSVLSAVKHYYAKIVLDSSSEAERPYRDLLEKKQVFIMITFLQILLLLTHILSRMLHLK